MTDETNKSETNDTLSDKPTKVFWKNIGSIDKHVRHLPRLVPFYITEHFSAVWLDLHINECNKDIRPSINKLQYIVNSVKIFHDANQCIDFITNLKNETVFLIITNDLSQWILSLIVDIPQIRFIYILTNIRTQSELMKKECQKVEGVFTSIDIICNRMKCNINKLEKDLTSISIISDSSNPNFNELDQSFMYSQILKEIIIDIKHDEKSKKEFINYCLGQYSNNEVQLNLINTFDRDYELHSPIWWYTKEPFIYVTLNQALRTQNIEIVIKMGFFLQDLHREIERIYNQIRPMTKIIVYRGQGMDHLEFETIKKNKAGLLSFNHFLSTSIDQQISLIFARSARDDPNLIGILFRLELDPSISSVPFAALDDISFYANTEKEILFSMHTIFRIDDILPIEDRLWQINLILTNDNDQHLMNLASYIRNEIGNELDGYVWLA